MQISSPQYGLITLNPISNDRSGNLWLPGSKTYYCEKDFGSILVKQYNNEQYFIRYVLLNLIKKIPLLFREEKPFARNRLVLKGGFKVKINEGKRTEVGEGQLILFGKNDAEETLYFGKGKEHSFFDTAYSENLLAPLMAAFPSLKEFINNSAPESEKQKLMQPRLAVPEITRIANNLLKCPYDETLRRIYFEDKVRDYLFQALVPALQDDSLTRNKKQKEKTAIYNARNIILSDLTRHIPIREISQQVQLNEKKLKKGFKHYFGIGIYECLTQARMEKAREMLMTTDKPIKEIASDTGFDYLTNFVTAFRKHFGDTPGELRSKRH